MSTIFYGWWIVLAISLIHFGGTGAFFYSFTAFFNPLVEEFGWSYAATSFAASLRSMESGIAAPLVGVASDRLGPRRILLIGSIFTGAGFLLFSQIQTLSGFYLVFIFLSIGSSMITPVPGFTAANNWFVKKRETVIGILSGAMGLGGVLIYAVNALIVAYGWRTTLIVIGIGIWVTCIPSSLVVRSRPEPYGLSPDGERVLNPAHANGERPLKKHMEGFTLGEAMKTRAYWAFALTMISSAAALHAVSVHVMPFLTSMNFSREEASLIASLLVFTSIAGRFGLGFLSSRVDIRTAMAIAMILQAAGLVFLSAVKEPWMALFFVVSFGTGYGGVATLRFSLGAQYFGRRAFGTIQGSVLGIMMIGTISSPILTGFCFDVVGDYRPAWLIIAVINIAVVPLILKIRPPQSGSFFSTEGPACP